MSNTITLGGVALNGAMTISDRDDSQAVAQSIKRTLAGNLKVFFASLTKGRQITLTADEEQGWITGSMVASLRAMADSAGSSYSLVINGVATSVIFRHNEPPAFSASPLVFRNNQQPGDYYTCTIKLLTV